MPIDDAVLPVTCDTCDDSDELRMSVRYADYSGKNWDYSVAGTLSDQGWDFDLEADKAICPNCLEEEED